MRTIVLERNKSVRRRLMRLLYCAGMTPITVEDPAQVAAHIADAQLLIADAFDGTMVAQHVHKHPTLRAILLTAEPLERCLRQTLEIPQMSNILGRPNFDTAPRSWELSMVLRRLSQPHNSTPPFSSLLTWGYTGFEHVISNTSARDTVVNKVSKFIEHLSVPKRVGEMFAELAHELVMNAMFDAPIDANGEPKYAQHRKANIELHPAERPTLRLAADGTKLVLQVTDPFGRLERKHVFQGLVRGLTGGQMDTSYGGAGLGMLICHNATVAMLFDVMRTKQTQVTGIFDLDLNLREFRTHGKSLHYFEI